jgi:LuxR family quorum sensing-dependent transcriptional regulator
MAAKSVDYGRLAFDTIDKFEGLSSSTQVIDHMSTALSAFGYSAFLVATAPELVGDAEPTFLLNGWPLGWADHYVSSRFYRDDPIAQFVRKTVDPFEWSDVPAKLQIAPRAKIVMRDAEDFGLRRGFCVPVFQNGGATAGVTMAGCDLDFDPRAKRAIHLIALYAHAKVLALINPTGLPARLLVKGEREVLNWIAAGKSSWDISVILGISEATVNWRIKRASEKLKAVNRTQAVVKAIRAKEINI